MGKLFVILFLLASVIGMGQTPTMTSRIIGPLPAYRGQNANAKIPFLECLSADAKQTRAGTGFIGKKYPLIIAFHGAGEKTSSFASMAAVTTADLSKLYNTSLPSLLRYTNSVLYNKRYAAPGYTDSTSYCYLFPQTYGGYTYTYLTYGYNMLKYAKDSLSDIIDTTQIYFVGLSLGGGSVMIHMQDPAINIQIAACLENCAGYIAASTAYSPTYNFKSWADWGGLAILCHSTNDSTTDKNPVTKEGSYYSDRANDSLLKYKGITTVIYKRWITGGHVLWDRAYNPENANGIYPQSNAQNSNFSLPFHSQFLLYSTRGVRKLVP